MLLLNLNMADFVLNSRYTTHPYPFALQSGLASHFNTTEPHSPVLRDLACSTKEGEPHFLLLYTTILMRLCASPLARIRLETCHQISDLTCRVRRPALVLRVSSQLALKKQLALLDSAYLQHSHCNALHNDYGVKAWVIRRNPF